MIRCTQIADGFLQQIGEFLNGLEFCLKSSYQIVYYYDEESQLPQMKLNVKIFNIL